MVGERSEWGEVKTVGLSDVSSTLVLVLVPVISALVVPDFRLAWVRSLAFLGLLPLLIIVGVEPPPPPLSYGRSSYAVPGPSHRLGLAISVCQETKGDNAPRSGARKYTCTSYPKCSIVSIGWYKGLEVTRTQPAITEVSLLESDSIKTIKASRVIGLPLSKINASAVCDKCCPGRFFIWSAPSAASQEPSPLLSTLPSLTSSIDKLFAGLERR